MSKTQRKLFEPVNKKENNLTSPINPGPGTYDYEKLAAKQFNNNGELSVFQSKVPNAKDTKVKSKTPGPGTYATVQSIEKMATDSLK